MRIRHLPWAIALVGVVLGFMLSTQAKVQSQVQLRDATTYLRAKELAQELQKAESDRDALMTDLQDLRTQMTNMANRSVEYKDVAAQLEQAQVHAGLIPLSGPGLIVEMRDSVRPPTPGENANNFIVHDLDVLQVINELFAAKADAISINEQRVIGRTEIRCAGPTITINGVRTAPPVIIKAIGNPEQLEAAIMGKDGVADSLHVWGVQVTAKKEQTLIVPAYKGSLKLQYGTPAK